MANNIYVIIPSLNPDEKLKNTVRGMLDAGFERIIIVNDGSDNEHLENFPHSDENITVIHRRQNHGKGAALKVAFRHILRNCPDAAGVVTVDSIGATRNDVIDLMVSYGAVNAGMLDGGSSAMMYYRNYFDKYSIDKSQLDSYQLKGLVNRYKAFTNPRRIPTYFIVSEEKK